MVRTEPSPADAGASPAFSPNREAMLLELQADAERTSQALASLIELLHGCPQDHQISAGRLLALLEPVAGSLDVLSFDLNTACSMGKLQ